MKETEFLLAFGEIGDTYIETAAATLGNTERAAHPRRKSKLTVLLIAAAISLCLMGAAAVGAIYGDSIQSWFSRQWALITRRDMSEGQMAVIDHLSQSIDESVTVGDVTVTVDSVTVGDGTFYLLLRAEGARFSSRYLYSFYDILMELSPDPCEEGTLGGYGFQYKGLDGDGAALFLMDFNYAGGGDAGKDTSPLQVTLTLRDLSQGAAKEKTVQEGEWAFTFTVDRSQPMKTVLLPDTQVELIDHASHKKIPVWIRNIRLTSTGIRFEVDFDSIIEFPTYELKAVLKNGVVVGNNGGFGTPLADGSGMEYSCLWQFPLDLDEVEYIQFTGTRIPKNEYTPS